MQTPSVVSLVLLIFAYVVAPNRFNPPTSSTLKNLSIRALQRQNSTPSTKAEISKAKTQSQASTKGSRDQPKPRPLDPLHRQNSVPTTKSNIDRAKKQVQSSSQDAAKALVADLVLGHQKDQATTSAAKAEASHRRVKDWQSQINAHFVSSWKAFGQGKRVLMNRHNQKIKWKAAMMDFNVQKARHHEDDAREVRATVVKMETSGIRLRHQGM